MVKRVIYNKKKYLGLENQLWYWGGEGRWSTEPGIGGGGRRGEAEAGDDCITQVICMKINGKHIIYNITYS